MDVIIIGRGGGSDEDLSAFNDEALAMRIFDCTVPIVSAVGHGDDVSITDMVADVHAPTPSAAAEITVFLYDDFVRDVNMRVMTLEREMRKHIDDKSGALRQRALRLEVLSPAAKIKLQRVLYSNRAQKLEDLMSRKLDAAKHKVLIYIEKYKGLSPVEKIGHGFAAVTDENGLKITDIASVSPGDKLRLIMREGIISATANAIEKRE